MGKPQTNDYRTLYFPKLGGLIKEQCEKKVKALDTRIKRRDETLVGMFSEAGIDRLNLAALMDASNSMETDEYGNPLSGSDAPMYEALPNLKQAEWTKIKAEITAKSLEVRERARLQLVARNLAPTELYKLSFQDLLYYEF